jgi:transaldolase
VQLFVDTANLSEIEEWNDHPRVSGFTTNPTLLRGNRYADAWAWAKELVSLTDKPVSIDGPPEVWKLGRNVWRKVVRSEGSHLGRQNLTAVCNVRQVEDVLLYPTCIVSVFAGRIMDAGQDPQPVIDAAMRTCASVLWASVREPYNIVQAEAAGCDIVTVPPAILRKYLDWYGMPLEVVAAKTIAQFEKDSEGLW